MKILIIVICILIVLVFAAGGYLFWFAIVRKDKFLQNTKREPTEQELKMKAAHEQGAKLLAALPHEDWSITTHDNLKLYGEYYPAAVKTEKTVICVHGYMSNGQFDFCLYAPVYLENGFNILVVDDRAHGKSEGRYMGFGWLDKDDVVQWAQKLVQRDNNCTILLAGVSMGAASVLMAGGCDNLPSNVKGIVSDCAFSGAYDEFLYEIHNWFHLPQYPLLPAASLISRILAHYGFKQASTTAQTAKIKVPVLFIHGSKDAFVPTYMVEKLYNACHAPKKKLIIDGAGHAMSYLTSPDEYKAAVLDFCSTLPL